MEIERKFIIKKLPEHLEQYECKVIEQGYLCSMPTVRIRKSNEEYYLTYKSKFGIAPTDASVVVSNETEVLLDQFGYEHLKQKIDDHLVKKKRYIIPIDGGLKIELDVFEGNLKGLMLAEIEFESEEQAIQFEMLDWFDRDVSNDVRYKNSYLSKLDGIDELL